MMTGRIFALLLLWLAASLSSCSAFTSPARSSPSQISSPSSLKSGLLGGLFGGDNSNKEGPKTVLEIPAKDIKVGALRFFLQIYLVGECNTPTKASWQCRQTESGGIDMFYKDATGMCSIDLTEYAIKVQRHGTFPSLQYQLQESVLLHGLLDELNTLAFLDDIEEEKRLLRFRNSDALDTARETLPAKKA